MLEPENSRRAERFYIEKLGLISVNGNNMQLRNCLVHDISMRGISLVVDDDTECVPGDKIDVMFRYGATLHNYELSTVVVRNFKLGKKNAVGCSISNLNIDLIGLLSSKKNEKQTKLDEAPATDLNPKITEQQQILEVEEDVARDIIPERPATITIRSGKQMNLKDMEESADSDDMAILRKNKEKKMADERREIESLLDLRNI